MGQKYQSTKLLSSLTSRQPEVSETSPAHARRVLLVGNFLSTSGKNRGVCEELAERLGGADWQVTTTSSHTGRLARLADMLATVVRRRTRYACAQVDVYSGPAFVWAEAVCLALTLLRRPYVLTLHGGNLPEFAHRWPGRVRRLLNSAAVVTTPSRFLLQEMAPYCPDMRLLPNAIDLKLYPFTLRADPRPDLVWLRAFHDIYNPALAVRALALLQSEFPDIHLTMIGPDKGDGSLQQTRQAATEFGVSERVQYSGPIPKADVPRHVNMGDIFLNTTRIDNTPVSVIEALACGLCIVSTCVGGIPYLLTHEQNALLVPPDDPQAMAEAVRRILTEPGLARRLSENGRATVEAFDWTQILPQWEALLAGIPGTRTV